MRELFIYWRTPLASAPQAIRAAEQWQARLREQHPALSATLYRRADESGATVTVMEVYAPAADAGAAPARAIDAELERLIVDQGQHVLGTWLDGPRHVEVFVRCTPP